MISACIFAVLLEHPAAMVHQTIESGSTRRWIMGVAMGFTTVCLIRSPWGQRSGAHMNPAVTLAYFALGKVRLWDAVFYALFQFAGAIGGAFAAGVLAGPPLRHASVNFAVSAPGNGGPVVAFVAEILISMLLMSVVLVVSNSRRWASWTPFVAGLLVAVYIAFASQLSGTSMNPARSLGSAVLANDWRYLWIYLMAPPLGMLMAAQLYRLRGGVRSVYCAKLLHDNHQRCIFRCNYGALHAQE
jgi:aquaporin Z